MVSNISILAAFIAGLLSFLSPCVLPLISSYLVFISGTKLSNSSKTNTKEIKIFSEYHLHILFSTLFFVIGFTTVFIILSILFSTIFILAGGANIIINAVSGIIVIVLGFNILFNFIPFLSYEKRIQITKRPQNFLDSFIVGSAFGAGWTPCIGPILGSILLMAGQSGKLFSSIMYLFAYSAGLGTPFLISAFFFSTFLKYIEKLKPWRHFIKIASGIFIIIIGVFIVFGRFQYLNSFFLKSGFVLSEYAKENTIFVKLIPAFFFLVIALIPLIYNLTKKTGFSLKFIIFFIVCLSLSVLQLTEIISVIDVFSKWLLFVGI